MTEYDIHQVGSAKVEGVGNNSINDRNNLLHKNNGKYSLFDEILSIPIGSYIDVYGNEGKKPTNLNNSTLLEFTHSNDNEYSQSINRKYGLNSDNKTINIKNLTLTDTIKWEGKYDNYIDFVSKVYGSESYLYSFLENALSIVDFKYALKQDDVGLIKNFDVNASLLGINKTNINNFSGTDTPLGIFTNRAYAETLKYSAHFNTLRNTQYITPDAQEYYGMNEYNINAPNKNFDINPETGRLSGTLGDNRYFVKENGLKIFTDPDSIIDLNDNTKRYLRDNLLKNKRAPINPYTSDVILYDDISTVIKEDGGENWYYNYHLYESDSNYVPFDITNNNALINKTNKLFGQRKIASLINRFHTSFYETQDNQVKQPPTKGDLLNSAVSKYGLSRGRNLLKKSLTSADIESEYLNPYCRVWTNNHQYNQLNKVIRPFFDEKDEPYGIAEFQTYLKGYARREDGRLGELSVLNNNGFVNITPDKDGIVDVKKTMFSIENLAWKDIYKHDSKNISKEQIGPLGGRIMWFPPYNIKFSENVGVTWGENAFIGRGENLYSYKNTKRSGSLSFDLIIDHPSIINYWKEGREGVNINDEELLRFYAGCEILDLPPLNTTLSDKTNIINNTDNGVDVTPSEVLNENSDIKEISFTVYFPNNYSGIDDLQNNSTSSVDAMTYLFCGWGVQELSPLPDISWLNSIESIGYEMKLNEHGISGNKNGQLINPLYQYRVDDSTMWEELRSIDNYIDFTTSKQLNANKDEFNTNSFAEVYAALTDLNGDNLKMNNFLTEVGVDNGEGSSLIELRNIFNNKDLEITNISIYSTASSQGKVDSNEGLSINRGKSISKWLLKSIKGLNSDRIRIVPVVSERPLGVSTNEEDAKLDRSAFVSIRYTLSTNTKASDTIIPSSDIATLIQTKVDDSLLQEISSISNSTTLTRTINLDEVERYDNESAFYKLITSDSEMIPKSLTQKIQHFNPAYHSMTPEGYNSRLTFLHQCTRQGHTMSLSDSGSYAKTAGNLAFGRPPVCVLRIGDFYNTKILIDNISINFEPLLWDLNPEGVGVQPMLAQIQMSFTFIGGSDLGGPIARLQNAASFNYYANSSAYDNRSDTVEYVTEDEAKYKQFTFTEEP